MSLPANFGGSPQEDLLHHYRTVTAEFKKDLKTSRDPSEIQESFERYMNILKHLNKDRKPTGTYHKDGGQKAAARLHREFDRYKAELEANHAKASPQSLIMVVTEIDQFIGSFQSL